MDLKNHIWKNEKEIPNNSIDDDNNGYIDDYYGWNFGENSNITYSNEVSASHGTHCAGIIAADHNKIGVMGILGNTNVKIMVLPIYSDNMLKEEDLIEAIKYADNMGAEICNISAIFVDEKREISNVIQCSNMYFVVSAGNFQNKIINGLDLDENKRFPACCDCYNVITVGSINEKEDISRFSNYSKKYVDIVASGEYIYNTVPNDKYEYKSGTSMSTAIVTGILGAYYYSYTMTIQDAAKLMIMNAKKNLI